SARSRPSHSRECRRPLRLGQKPYGHAVRADRRRVAKAQILILLLGGAVNIVNPIMFQCRINAEQPAICSPGANFEPVTYVQLELMMNALTRAVLQHDFQRGQVVGVLIGNKIMHVVLSLALARIGVVTVSCRGRSLPKELGAVAVMTDTAGPFANV